MYTEDSLKLAQEYNEHLREQMSQEVREAARNAEFDKADKLVEDYIETSTVINQMITWAYNQNESTD